ncbi:MAG: gliding motility-associated C-terminal domain-containing protein [Lewinellaceae bacterium]|nr:gliding motility-associated C-terminal domain-containing protein [Phaeodactylibacter sp.]MCB0612720.1 gliding motility-associated C-terminal domain-containing protein [Phaeodactylibacter sp.]MCB9346964.1 gliding motility-associated C-terminal domain-containing protein [Lewinellaceae bacterium]
MLRSILSIIGTLTIFILQAQPASFQDCLGAIPVCQQVYEENRAPVGNGNIVDFESANNCTLGEDHSIWYTFTVNNSGQFGFLLTPNNPDQDYDWILFDVTNATCQDLSDDPSLVVSCNAAGGSGCNGPTGATGDTDFAHQGPDCNTFPPDINNGFSPFNELVDVEAGNTYALCILNFSNVSSQGYTLDFGLSAGIGIFDETPPFLADVFYPDSCNGQEMVVRFSEYIQCSTLDASNFRLSGPGGPYALTLSSENCDAGGNAGKEFLLTASPPVSPGGEMSLALIVDGSTQALDLCDNPAGPVNLSFAGPTLSAPVDLGPDTALCPSQTLWLDATTPGATYLWSDGSTEPTLLVDQPGLYSVIVTGECGEAQDEINVGVSDPITAALNDASLCPGENVTFDVATAGATYLWQDGSTGPTYTAATPGVYSVTISNACQVVELYAEVGDAHVPIPDSILGNDTTLCPGEGLLLELDIPGVSYLWQDGSVAAGYQVMSPGSYSVTVANECESRSDSIQVSTVEPLTVSLPEDTVLCPGTILLLDVTDENATAYLWQDNSTEPVFQVKEPGTYTVLVANPCEAAPLSIRVGACERCKAYVPNAFSPNNDGRNDLFQPYTNCPVEAFSLKVFNRWGAIVYESTSINEGWDGTFNGQAVGTDVYIYSLQITVLENGKARDIDLSGDISVIR